MCFFSKNNVGELLLPLLVAFAIWHRDTLIAMLLMAVVFIALGGSVGLVLYYWCGDHHSMSHWINQPTVESTRGASLLHHAFRLIFWLIQWLFDWWPCGRIEQWATNLNPVVKMYILTNKLFKGLDSNIDISQGWGADIKYLTMKKTIQQKLFQKKIYHYVTSPLE